MISPSLINRVLLTAQEAAGHAEHAENGGHGSEGGIMTHLPSVLNFFSETFAQQYAVTFFAFLIAFMMIVASVILFTRRQMIPSPFQNAVEMIFETLYNLVYSMLGKETDRYIPFLATLFLYIWFMNLSGIVPFFHSPTTTPNMTLALSITVFVYVQFTAVIKLGPFKYLHHLAGEPTSAVTWVLSIINFPLHVIGEFIKPFSLAMRLFGNIFGEDTLIAVMVSLGVLVLSTIGSPVGLPFQIPFYFLSLLLGTIQALVFTMLSTGYIMMVLPHGEHEH